MVISGWILLAVSVPCSAVLAWLVREFVVREVRSMLEERDWRPSRPASSGWMGLIVLAVTADAAVLICTRGGALSAFRLAACFAVQSTFIAALVACSWIDLRIGLIPDRITLPGVLAATAASVALPFTHGLAQDPVRTPLAALASAGAGVLVGAGVPCLIRFLGRVLMGKLEALGWGVVKFGAFLGALLGARGVGRTFLIAILVAVAASLLLKLFKKRIDWVEAAPGLSVAAVAVLWFPQALLGALERVFRTLSIP